MKISRYLKIDENMKWGLKEHVLLSNKHRYKHSGYLVVVSERPGWLFEIISSRLLSDYYEAYYVIGIMPTKQMAVNYVVELVSRIYNEHTLTYEALKHK